MKITKSQLKQIIKEELENFLSEDPSDRLKSMGGTGVFAADPRDQPASLASADVSEPAPEPEEIDSWVGLPYEDVADLLRAEGLNPNTKWYLSLPVSDPRRVKFRAWYNCSKGRASEEECRPSPSAQEKAEKLLAHLRQATDELITSPEAQARSKASMRKMSMKPSRAVVDMPEVP
mgnify:CR=1 FL=1|tara:strand:+ start:3880 stop:4407 length:528 start_codon:yes stop_codon:yes gene_type:complete